MKHEPLITAADLAARLNMSVGTVYSMCRTHEWPHVRVGRLYRFTEEQYRQIITPPPVPTPRPRNQRQRIAELLSRLDK